MNIIVVYGTERKGCTYNITQSVLKNFDEAGVEEVFLPRDCPDYCVSCFKCFEGPVESCPHAAYVLPIRRKLIKADLIILTSPVYAFHMTGQMKVMLDHFANMWLVHRPEESMFKKQALVIASASGPVYKKTLKGMMDSLDFWGVKRTFKLGVALFEVRWDNLSDKKKAKIDKKAKSIARQIIRKQHNVTPKFRVRMWYLLMKLTNKKGGTNPTDAEYWREKGWLTQSRPW